MCSHEHWGFEAGHGCRFHVVHNKLATMIDKGVFCLPLQVPHEGELYDTTASEEDSESRGSEECCSTSMSPQDDAYVEVGHEDVVDAVADFVKERIQCNMLCSQYQPKDLAAAVDLAFADEKQGRWRRLWGRGRYAGQQ